MLVCTKHPEESANKLVELIQKINTISGCKIKIQKNISKYQ